VGSGKYSALHYALLAEYWSQQAAASVTGAMIFIGTYNASANTFPPGASTGYMYRIATAGTLGPFDDGVTRPVGVGDHIIKTASSWAYVDAMDQTLDTSRITTGQFPLARLPRAVSGFLRAKGTGADPAYEALVASDIPALDTAKVTTGQFPVARMPRAVSGFLRGKGTTADPAYEALVASDIPALDTAKVTTGQFPLARMPRAASGFLRGKGTAADPTYETLAPEDIPTLNQDTTGKAGSAEALAVRAEMLNTTTAGANKWARLLRVTLTAQYQDAGVTLYLKSYGNGGGQDQYDVVQFRVKQQAVFGNNPLIELLPNVQGLEAAEYGYVIVQNTPSTVVDLYVKNKVMWNVIRCFELARASASGSVIYYSNEAYVASVAGLVPAVNRIDINSENFANHITTDTIPGLTERLRDIEIYALGGAA